ncbi:MULTISPECIES: CopG family transcriptional regulator [unclassified Nostoc]|uniref:CopG family transcriptional regulator n=1 Tax=unclassified Nostoc TaxID=2593658 RepID=UPI002AD5A37F|nr:CopG family transcriptional regulator [Nostoc sp. DedQUE03]MDZ7973643.1 CopG family transcriptional regulator [Nostoc sp. DedQUE03]MDZ8049617.1 CopG family transcriptional regulator [Nostoc sp. DedQUE02]
MRINARLDDEYADKLAYIQQQTNQAVTDVIKSALELYYQQLQQQQKNSFSMLTETGFIGCGEADPKLSINYKSILRDGLKAKYDYR